MQAINILIVEDDIITQERIARQLEIMGYHITGKVETGEAALASLQENLPDLILLDIELKGEMNGIQVAEKIFSEWQIPFIFLTAFSDANTIAQAKQTHPAYFLPKPYTIKNLTVAIEFALAAQGEATAEKPSFSIKNNSIFVRKKDQYVKVRIEEILWVKAEGSSVMVCTQAGKKHLISANLKNFCLQCNHPDLVRINRSYLLNIQKVEAINGRQLVIDKKQFLVREPYVLGVLKHFPIIKNRV